MGTEDNKAVVRRFMENVASGHDVSVADDVRAPGYVNLAFEGVDVAGLKAMTSALHAVIGEARTSSVELVAGAMRCLRGSTTRSPCLTGPSERHVASPITT